MKQPNQDPSARSGNSKLKNGARALTAVAALTLAACTTPSQEAKPADTKAPATAPVKGPETSTTTGEIPIVTASSPEQLKEAKEVFNRRSQGMAQELATQIINDYNAAPAGVEHWLYEPKDDPNHGVAVNYLPTAGTTLGGQYGEYVITANVSRDAQGNLDPTTVSSVFVGMNVNNSGNKKAEKSDDRENIYKFMLQKDFGGDWHWSGSYKYSEQETATYDFEPNKGSVEGLAYDYDDRSIDEIMTYLTSDAHRIINWSETGTPVEYPVAASGGK